MRNTINILVTLDSNYVPYLNVMLESLIFHNSDLKFNVYLLNSSLTEDDVADTRQIIFPQAELILIKADDSKLDDAPTTSRYPKEIYYRIFAARFLPENLDRILYLDPDVIINGSIEELYNIDMEDYFFAAASHNGNIMHKINEIRLDMDEDSPYINSGVMLINLNMLRKEQNFDDVFRFIEKYKSHLILPDQDIISSLYGSRIIPLDTYKYNMTERLYIFRSKTESRITLDWIRKNSVIIHYCGRNKPWKDNYIGKLNVFYNEALCRLNSKRKLKEI